MRSTAMKALCGALTASLCACADGTGGGGGDGGSEATTSTTIATTTSSVASTGAGNGAGGTTGSAGADGAGGTGGIVDPGVGGCGGTDGEAGSGGAGGSGGTGGAAGTGGAGAADGAGGSGGEGSGAGGAGSDGVCDCGCGESDFDCVLDPRSDDCAEGEICVDDACVAAATNDECSTATPLVEGTVSGTWHGADDDYSPGSYDNPCTHAPAFARDVVYTVTLEPGQTLAVAIAPVAGDPSLYLVTDCADTELSCVAGADSNDADEIETLVYTATAGGDFFLIVDQFGLSVGAPFTLEVSIEP